MWLWELVGGYWDLAGNWLEEFKKYLTLDNIVNFLGLIGIIYGVYKWWHTMERNMVARLDDFLDREHTKLKTVRENIRSYRAHHGTPFLGQIELGTNPDLRNILKKYQSGRSYSLFNIENELERALDSTDVRLNEAKDFVERHREQKAVAKILLGASLVGRGEHRKALEQFEGALDIDGDDIEALDYAGNQHINLREPEQAIEKFNKIIEIAESMYRLAETSEQRTEADVLIARAHRGRGLAYQIPPRPNVRPPYRLAYGAYTEAKGRFPENGGPQLDFADIHLLRGEAAIEIGNWNKATNSLHKAVYRFDELVEEGGDFADLAKIGKVRAHAAQKELAKRRNAPPSSSLDDGGPLRVEPPTSPMQSN